MDKKFYNPQGVSNDDIRSMLSKYLGLNSLGKGELMSKLGFIPSGELLSHELDVEFLTFIRENNLHKQLLEGMQ